MTAASTASRSNESLASPSVPFEGFSQSCATLNHNTVTVESLVDHLLAAKKSLSSMTLVLRANDITQLARKTYEEIIVLNAQSEFLHHALADQVRLLLNVRRGLTRTYDGAKHEFSQIVHTLDIANERLDSAMRALRSTTVESIFRPRGESPRNLMDFIDEESVSELHQYLRKSLGELQVGRPPASIRVLIIPFVCIQLTPGAEPERQHSNLLTAIYCNLKTTFAL